MLRPKNQSTINKIYVVEKALKIGVPLLFGLFTGSFFAVGLYSKKWAKSVEWFLNVFPHNMWKNRITSYALEHLKVLIFSWFWLWGSPFWPRTGVSGFSLTQTNCWLLSLDQKKAFKQIWFFLVKWVQCAIVKLLLLLPFMMAGRLFFSFLR